MSTGFGLVALVSSDQAFFEVSVCMLGLVRGTPYGVCRDESSETTDSPGEVKGIGGVITCGIF